MKSLTLLAALLLSSFLMAQNTEKSNSSKHIQITAPANPKGFPIWESFEDLLMPPTGWQLLQGPTPQTWDTSSFDPAWGIGYVKCLYDESLSGVQNEYLITRVMDLSTFSNVSVAFYFQFSKYWGISPNDNYDLLLLASTDSAQTFPDTLWSEMSTDTATWNSFEWVHASVDLSAYIDQEKFALAFVYSGYDGAEAALDMVAVETVGGFTENSLSLKAFPNPADGVLNIESASDGDLTMSDLQGRVVLQKYFRGNETIDVSALEPGKYFVTLRAENAISHIPVVVAR